MSFDPPEKNAEWAEEKGFSFELWSDASRDLARYYGAADSPEDSRARRVTRVLDADGDLVLEYDVGIGIAAHPKDVLHDVRQLFR